MKKFSLGILTLLAIIGLSGCSVKVPQYNSSADNVVQLRTIDFKLNVGTFTATHSAKSTLCRLARTVVVPHGLSFEKYIENAFTEELKMADKYSSESNITITANLNNLKASSGLASTGYWSFDMTIQSSNGKSFDITSKHIYDTSFIGAIACNEMMPNAFKPAVQKLIKEVVSNPKFNDLLH